MRRGDLLYDPGRSVELCPFDLETKYLTKLEIGRTKIPMNSFQSSWAQTITKRSCLVHLQPHIVTLQPHVTGVQLYADRVPFEADVSERDDEGLLWARDARWMPR
jgi:hypothetical protein